jgi:hypothetical protein
VELVREGLNHALHQVLLSHFVFAHDDDLQDFWQHDIRIDIKSDAIKVAQADDIFSDRDSKFIPLHFSLIFVLVAG